MKNKNSFKVVASSLLIVMGLLAASVLIYTKNKAERGNVSQTDQAKNVGETLKEAADTMVDKFQDKEAGDDFFANYIMKFTKKQEHINELLKAEGSNYRIGNIEVEVGVPPKVSFIIQDSAD